MVTGRVPFYHEDKRNIMNTHLHTSLTPPDHINKKLSIGISEMIEIMMKKNPEDRGDFVPSEMSALEYEIIIRRQRIALIVCVVSLVILILIIFLMLLL